MKKVYTIASGKGGTGKTTFSVNVGIAMARNFGYRVLVVDSDFMLPSVGALIGIVPQCGLKQLLSHNSEKYLRSAVQQTKFGIDVLVYYSDFNKNAVITLAQMKWFADGVLKLPYDVVIFDAGAGINRTMLELVSRSTDVIIVTMPDPVALVGSYKTIAYVKEFNESCIIYYVINRVTDIRMAMRYVSHYISLVRSKLNREIVLVDMIPHEQAVIDAGVRQIPFYTAASSRARASLDAITHRLSGIL